MNSVYEQFAKEARFKYKWRAQHVVKQIDNEIKTRIQIEQERPFEDYGFYKVTGSSSLHPGSLILSPLARLPDTSKIPGIIGFFQVDEAGLYSCPLLPYADNQSFVKEALKLHIEEKEIDQRLKLRDIIRPILIKNGLLKTRKVTYSEVFDYSQPSSEDELSQSAALSPDTNEYQSPDKPQSPAKKVASIIKPFTARLDDGGYLMFSRNVWRGQEKIVQGFVVKEPIFLNDILMQAFHAADFDVPVLLKLYSGERAIKYMLLDPDKKKFELGDSDQPEGRLLASFALAEPLQDLHIEFSAVRLPLSRGALVGTVLLCLVLVIMATGLWLIYRLGVRQIDLNEERLNFVSAVSHELKTPLTSIIMYAEMLRDGIFSSEEKRQGYYDFIFFEGERLSRLISNVLRLAKIDRNDSDIELSKVSIATVLDLVRSKTSTLIENSAYTLNLSCDSACDDKQQLLIDSDAFVQVAINLVDNAIKFSKDHIPQSEQAPRNQVDIGFAIKENDPKFVCFSVRDYGPGIDKAQGRDVFNAFYRVGNELTRKTQGTGIGLSLVQALCASMGGRVDYVNRDIGVEFRVCFERVPAV